MATKGVCVSVWARACVRAVGNKADGLVRTSQILRAVVEEGNPINGVQGEEASESVPAPGSKTTVVSGRNAYA